MARVTVCEVPVKVGAVPNSECGAMDYMRVTHF